MRVSGRSRQKQSGSGPGKHSSSEGSAVGLVEVVGLVDDVGLVVAVGEAVGDAVGDAVPVGLEVSVGSGQPRMNSSKIEHSSGSEVSDGLAVGEVLPVGLVDPVGEPVVDSDGDAVPLGSAWHSSSACSAFTSLRSAALNFLRRSLTFFFAFFFSASPLAFFC